MAGRNSVSGGSQGRGQVKSLHLCSVFCVLWSVLCALYSAAVPSYAADSPVNREFHYNIYWTGIKAGEAVLYYESSHDGTTIRTHATSAPLISIFYKVDDTAESTIYPDGYPKRFRLRVRQGRHKRDKETLFERVNGAGLQKVIFNNIRDEETSEHYFETPAYDVLSAFYEMTKWDLKVGTSYFINIFDNNKLWNTEVKVLRRERVRVEAGEFDTIVVQPILQSEGIFPKTGDMTIWATDDGNKLPVLMKSKATLGYFKAVLTDKDH
jgi:hypothetical protein